MTADAWLQSADFNSIEKAGVDLRFAIAFWNAVDVEKEDMLLRKLQDGNAEFCAWGMGISSAAGHLFHAFRDLGGYEILIQTPTRILGFIPSKKEQVIKGVSREQVEGYLRQWWGTVVG